MKKLLNNKIFKITYGIIKYVFIAIIVLYLAFMAYQKFSNDSIGGYRIYTIATGSMEPVYKVGDVIVIKEQDNYSIGDIITYKTVILGEDSTITHRIIKMDGDNIQTKGDANEEEDDPITKDKVLGKSIKKLYLFSCITKLLKNKFIFFFALFVPLIVIISLEMAEAVLNKEVDEDEEE